MIWDQLTSPQLNALDRRIPVIFPVSATEQHGPHLPVATDRMIGEYLCTRLHEKIPEAVLILPIMSVGCSEHHMDFCGSLSISHETFLSQAEDILSSVVHHGFSNLVLFNCHGGNLAVGSVLLERLGIKYPECQWVMATWWKIISDRLLELSETGPGGVGHAGEFETSMMLAIAPELVHLDKRESKKNIETYAWAEMDMLRGAKAALFRTMKQMTSNGAYGDTSLVSAEKGEQIIGLAVEGMKEIILDLYRSGK